MTALPAGEPAVPVVSAVGVGTSAKLGETIIPLSTPFGPSGLREN